MKAPMPQFGWIVLPFAFATAAIIAGGCGTTVGNPAVSTGDVSLSIQGTRPGAALSSFRLLEEYAFSGKPWLASTAETVAIQVTDKDGTAIGTITLTEARLALKEIKLEKEGSNRTGDKKSEYEGPFVVDLLTNSVTPALSGIALDPGVYKQIKLKLAKTEAGGPVATTDPLFGNSIYLAGTYTGDVASGGSVTAMPMTLSFDLDEEFQLTGDGGVSRGFTIESAKANSIVIAFRLARWFRFTSSETNPDRKDFSNLQVTNVNGTNMIVLSANSSDANKELRKVIKDNIKKSADYGKDADGDGKLESSEDDDPDETDSED